MVKLVERVRVKDALGIARMDGLYDETLTEMIEQASEEAETYCRRKFTYAARVEYHTSYEQGPSDPDPQYIWLDGPVDQGQPISIVWAPYQNHDDVGLTLSPPQDYRLDAEKSLIVVGNSRGVLIGVTLAPYIYPYLTYSQTGFKVTYTGGYQVNPAPIPNPNPDPTDDYNVVAVPMGLKSVLVKKIAADFTTMKMLCPWSPEELVSLKPYAKKNLI